MEQAGSKLKILKSESWFKLQIGKKINFGNAKPDIKEDDVSSNSGDEVVRSIQKNLNSRYKAGLVTDGFNDLKSICTY